MNILKEAFASDPLPPAAAPEPRDGIKTAMQTTLRNFGVLSVVGGVIGGMFNAIQSGNQTAVGFLVWAEWISEGIVLCVLLYGFAAVIDALRIIAARLTPPTH
ncbi:hypothetical protein [Metallibacterium sp.]|uniref:hypothetical protein n=1 Tax=Metallibacterium sp. TaxID=2940281 RepID=UPI002604CD77|nr:hypothetical protein [Metallibacterium sp.]